MPEAAITQQMLGDDLRGAGIRLGSVVIVHSSLKAIGPVIGGARSVVGALMDAVGPQGTLLLPTFSYPQPDGIFRVASTPSRTGAMTESFRQSAGAIRSLHPTHSVSAWGARTEEFTAGHELTSGLGVGSPFHRAAAAGAMMLMIGCDLRACSVVHVAEAITRVPYLGRVWFEGRFCDLTLITPDGVQIHFPPRDLPACSTGFTVVQSLLEERRLLKRIQIGHARSLLFSAADALTAAIEMLESNPAALLCHDAACPVCPKAKAIITETVRT
ncbi:N/A [soil metagenome]